MKWELLFTPIQFCSLLKKNMNDASRESENLSIENSRMNCMDCFVMHILGTAEKKAILSDLTVSFSNVTQSSLDSP